ncbi:MULTISPECIES: hypothetical protein [unclassified Clostridium]|uniref:hypothetical protein n=1 Tax=unclassified Clostridium TaxID=2614128 RepID=UPI00023AF508|nr:MULTISPECIES: hypothetical protein [unclassified Clostridium]EHI97846.1 hypothetical protein CDLVIII_1143 [Clostridium sp. DL-VIII]OOM80821.1 hypothetical protein CLOBL_06540 [Clostridium sp. BL-8]
MPSKSRTNIGRKPAVITAERVKKKKETILIEVAKDQVIGELINGFEVIKPVKRYGKYYVLVKNN